MNETEPPLILADLAEQPYPGHSPDELDALWIRLLDSDAARQSSDLRTRLRRLAGLEEHQLGYVPEIATRDYLQQAVDELPPTRAGQDPEIILERFHRLLDDTVPRLEAILAPRGDDEAVRSQYLHGAVDELSGKHDGERSWFPRLERHRVERLAFEHWPEGWEERRRYWRQLRPDTIALLEATEAAAGDALDSRMTRSRRLRQRWRRQYRALARRLRRRSV